MEPGIAVTSWISGRVPALMSAVAASPQLSLNMPKGHTCTGRAAKAAALRGNLNAEHNLCAIF